ncbi:MAG: FapA family protein [Spirochaetales bacterium]|nr:FapA family protein [Spirochaetales bacterium]
MANLLQLREYMRHLAEEDRKKKSVTVTGATIEDALNQAAIELSLPLARIEYEVLDPGKRGTFGMGRKDCIIIAYERVEAARAVSEEDFNSGYEDASEDNESPDLDGEVFVRLTSDGVLMKITSPIGKGKRVSAAQAASALEARGIDSYNESIVTKAVKRGDNEWIRVAEYVYNPANDAIMTVDITDFAMKAFVVIRPPGDGGADPSADLIKNFLKNNNVVHGIKEDIVSALETRPLYNESVLIAEGTQPKDGADAKIIYNFERDTSQIQLKEKNGRVDFREQNIVQNVVEGQALAKKIPAAKGENGRTVTGKLLPAKNGKDVQLAIGKNVKLSSDGLTAVATINGQVIIHADKINVEPIYVVNGDVNLKSGGNVIFLGTVFVKGGVEDGFKVKAAGNIEIMGNVGKCELDAEGDIIIHQGINGRGGGVVRSGKSVWAKFIENARVGAGEFVVVSDGIINSTVDADKKIICQGKRATIVGGQLRASEEIHAKNIGSIAGAETLVEVGFDPKSVERIRALEGKIAEIDKQLEEIELNIHTLENVKKMKKKLPDEKEAFLDELVVKKGDLDSEKESVQAEIKEVQEYLSSLKVNGKISASGKVFPGVRVAIKEAVLKIRSEFKAVTFVSEGGDVRVTKYEELEGDYTKKTSPRPRQG